MKHYLVIIVCLAGLLSVGRSQEALDPGSLVEASRQSGQAFSDVALFSRSTARFSVDARHRQLVRSGTMLNLDLSQAGRFQQGAPPAAMTLRLPADERTDLELLLVEVNPFADDFKVATSEHPEGVEVALGTHYRGVVKDVEGSIAALSVFDGEISAVFSTPEAGNFVLGKVQGSGSNDHILYREAELLVSHDFQCDVAGDTGRGYTAEELMDRSANRALSDCVNFFYETEYDILQNKGSVQAVSNYVTSLHNQVATLYANENINTRASEVFVWTSSDLTFPTPGLILVLLLKYLIIRTLGLFNLYNAYYYICYFWQIFGQNELLSCFLAIFNNNTWNLIHLN